MKCHNRLHAILGVFGILFDGNQQKKSKLKLHVSETCSKCKEEIDPRNMKEHISDFKKHVKKLHRNGNIQFKCHLCETSFDSKEKVVWHIINLHDGKNLFKCKCYTESFVQENDFIKHVENTMNSYRKILPKSKFVDKDNFYGEKKPEVQSFSTIIGTGSPIQIQSGLSIRASRNVENVTKLSEHIEKLNGQSNINEISQDLVENVHDKSYSIWNCGICNTSFMNKEHFETHTKTIHGTQLDEEADERKQEFQCNNCNASFETVQGLRSHFETIHEEKKYFQCSFCPEKFSESSIKKFWYYFVDMSYPSKYWKVK